MTNSRTLKTEYNPQNYTRETKTAIFQGKSITVTHLTPVLTPDERAKRKREIEHQLYDVFVKYAKSDRKAG
jgi:hypothetical protein